MSIITILLALPLVGALLLLFLQKQPQLAKYVAIACTGAVFLGSLFMLAGYEIGAEGYQFLQDTEWFPAFGVSFAVGLDSLSLPLFMLTTLLCFLVVIYSWDVTERAPFYYGLLLVLETGVLGVFSALDFFLFYIFWEIVLIPMFFLIGIWGGERRSYASMKFLIYTHVASLIMLLAIGAMFFKAADILGYYTFSIPEITATGFDLSFEFLVFPALLFAFCVKLPVVPVHTWLPDAHVEAPTAASVLLAGVLLKMGGYGLIRVAYMLCPTAARQYTWLVVLLALLSIVYGAFVAFKQDDLKKLIAYSSISHMGFVLIGIASFDEIGIMGAVFQMVAHGLISAMLFMVCGILQHSVGTRRIGDLGGVASVLPRLSAVTVFTFFASVGLPGLLGFIPELQVFLGAFSVNKLLTVVAMLSMIVTAAYYLWALERAYFGQPSTDLQEKKPHDLQWFQTVPLVVLGVLVLALGVWPAPITDMVAQGTGYIIDLLGGVR